MEHIAALESENARLRAELAKARAIAEPLERLLASERGRNPIMLHLSHDGDFSVSVYHKKHEGRMLAEALAAAEARKA